MKNSKWVVFTVPRKDFFNWESDSSLQTYIDLLKNQILPAIDELVNQELIENYHFLTHILENGMNLTGTKRGGLDFYILPIADNKLSRICEIVSGFGIPVDYENTNGDHLDTENVLKSNTEILRTAITRSETIPKLRQTYSHLFDCLTFFLYKNNSTSNLQEIIKKFNLSDDFNDLIQNIVNISLNQTKACSPEQFKGEILHFLNNSIGMSSEDEVIFITEKGFISRQI